MNINKLVSTNQIFADLEDETGINRAGTPKIKRLINRAVYKLCNRLYLKPFICVLTFDKNEIQLPARAVMIQGSLWGDHGTECWELFSRYALCIGDVRQLNLQVAEYNEHGGANGPMVMHNMDYHIQDSTMRFMQDYDKQKMTVLCWGYEDDDCGGFMVPQRHIDAILAWCKWKLADRSRWKTSQFKMTDRDINEYMRQWTIYYRQAKGDSDFENEADNQYMAGLASSLNIPFPVYYWSLNP